MRNVGILAIALIIVFVLSGCESNTSLNANDNYEESLEYLSKVEENHIDSANIDMPLSIKFDEDTTLDLNWNWDLFNIDSSEYCHDLAMAAIILSQAAEMGEVEIYSRETALGFENIKSIWYGGNEDNMQMPASTFASRLVEMNGEETIVISLVVRGSGDSGDWLTNFYSQFDGFYDAANNVRTEFKDYYYGLNEYFNMDVIPDNSILFLTGHSHGAAMAGQLGQMLEGSCAHRNKIFVYTFASPNYQTFEYDRESYTNIHNIINLSDSVPNVPVGYKRYGHDWYYERDRGNVVENHILKTYLACLLNGLPTNMGEGAVNEYDVNDKHYKEDTEVSLVGVWQSIGESGFGQAQPGAIVTFDADTCNFYSPNDTYELYQQDGRIILECTSYIFSETLTFDVDVIDDDNIVISYGSTVTTLSRVNSTGNNEENFEAFDTSVIVPSGTYYSTDGFNQVFTFYDNGTVTMSAFGIQATGSYKIANGKISIRYNFLGEQLWTPSFSMSGDSLFIAGVEFVKQ